MKHLIKIKSVEHGTLSCIHAGKDGQYAEAGSTVFLDWQPSTGWGLQEAHYVGSDGTSTPINLAVKSFTMPDDDITLVGTFKRFGVGDWTEGRNTPAGMVFLSGVHGQPVASAGAIFSIGSFDNNNLPTLDGFDDAGKVAYSTTLRQYVVWDGYGWTYMDGTPISPRYLKVVGTNFAFYAEASAGTAYVPTGWNLEYSTDGGREWSPYTIGLSGSEQMLSGTVLFRGVNPEGFYEDDGGGNKVFLNFTSDNKAECSGDLTSLVNGFGGNAALPSYCFYKMFQYATMLESSPNLPSTTLAEYCYAEMFNGCGKLKSAPELPATVLAQHCYEKMFYQCTLLTVAPKLPATMLAASCYLSMFEYSGVVVAPELPATTLVSRCYMSMFAHCTGLTTVPFMPADVLAANCYATMFDGCTGVDSYHFATLNAASNMFRNNSACAELTIDDENPPTINNSTITGLKLTCDIYVPADSVDDYKAAQYWSARASYIKAKP